jgi:3-deoxy-D-manno-octulosonic-acid transferase
VVFGPHVWNFADTVARLIEARAACQVGDAGQLETMVRLLLEDAEERRRLGAAARDFVSRQQGATEQTVTRLSELLNTRQPLAA